MTYYFRSALFVLFLGTSIQPLFAQSLAQKVGQMIMVGYINSDAAMDTLITDITERNLGGIIHFGYNISSRQQIADRNADLQSMANTKLFLATDQEGGRVARLNANNGFETTSSAAFTGMVLNSVESTRSQAEKMAGWFEEIGMNVNLGPVVDVNVNSSSPAIGALQRSYSSNPIKVAAHARAFIDAFSEKNVATTLKHFPGHGSAMADSHFGFTDVTNTWTEMELTPYSILIQEEQPDMIMTGHLFNENLDPDYPASISHNTLNSLLFDSLGYTGIVISDEMFMRALRDNFTFDEAIVLAINAGTDILLFNNNQCTVNAPCGDQNSGSLVRYVINLVEQKVTDGEIQQEQIDISYQKVLDLKETKLSTDIRNEEMPISSTLHQNYPNPFNPTTTIQFDMPAYGYAKIIVYDMMGRIVQQLAEGNYNAGTHRITLDASNMASGVYIYTLRTDAGIQTRSMTLIK